MCGLGATGGSLVSQWRAGSCGPWCPQSGLKRRRVDSGGLLWSVDPTWRESPFSAYLSSRTMSRFWSMWSCLVFPPGWLSCTGVFKPEFNSRVTCCLMATSCPVSRLVKMANVISVSTPFLPAVVDAPLGPPLGTWTFRSHCGCGAQDKFHR